MYKDDSDVQGLVGFSNLPPPSSIIHNSTSSIFLLQKPNPYLCLAIWGLVGFSKNLAFQQTFEYLKPLLKNVFGQINSFVNPRFCYSCISQI